MISFMGGILVLMLSVALWFSVDNISKFIFHVEDIHNFGEALFKGICLIVLSFGIFMLPLFGMYLLASAKL